MPPKSRRKSGKKRTERSFSTSPLSTDTPKKARMNSSEGMQEADKISQLFGLIEGLGERLENRLHEIQINMDTFRQEIKDEIKGMKNTVTEIEKSLEEVWSHIEDNEEQLKAQKETKECQQNEIDEMKSELASLQGLLAKEREKNTALENYTRRENLKFMNIPEREGENCKELVLSIVRNELHVNTDNIRFHAVHRMGKVLPGRNRPIIARFVCREDKDLVWSKKKKLQLSTTYKDAYITLDYAKDIQEERKVLIKAMIKARKQGIECKVIDRYLIIGHNKFRSDKIPENLKEQT